MQLFRHSVIRHLRTRHSRTRHSRSRHSRSRHSRTRHSVTLPWTFEVRILCVGFFPLVEIILASRGKSFRRSLQSIKIWRYISLFADPAGFVESKSVLWKKIGSRKFKILPKSKFSVKILTLFLLKDKLRVNPVCPRSLAPFCIVTNYRKWVKTSLACSITGQVGSAPLDIRWGIGENWAADDDRWN